MLHFDAVPSPVRSLLSLLPRRPALAGFALGGGTSLALRCGHRVSVDLDFFTTRAFDPEQLALQLGLPDPDPVSLSGMTWLDVKTAIRASVAALV